MQAPFASHPISAQVQQPRTLPAYTHQPGGGGAAQMNGYAAPLPGQQQQPQSYGAPPQSYGYSPPTGQQLPPMASARMMPGAPPQAPAQQPQQQYQQPPQQYQQPPQQHYQQQPLPGGPPRSGQPQQAQQAEYPSYPSTGHPAPTAPPSQSPYPGTPTQASTAATPYPGGAATGPYGSSSATSQPPSIPNGTQPYGRHISAGGGPSAPQPEMLTAMNAPLEFCRPTLNKAPHSTSLKQKSQIPLGVVIRPLASTSTKVMDVHFGANGKVVRCHRCRTYVNPFCTWEASGRRWTCNICNFANDTPQHYACNLDETGRRADRHERPELSMGSVEFIAPGDYMVRPPQPPAFLFLIDVSAPAIASGLVATVCQGLKTAISTGSIPGGSRTQIGIITFDSAIHFYKLDSQSGQSTMMVVPNLSDVFVPLPDGVLVNLEECSKAVSSLLDSLPQMWSSQRIHESCAGSAMKAAYSAMKAWGGKLSIFLSSTPTLGDLVGHRDSSHAATGADRESELLKPANEQYKQFATLMTQAQIGVDMYVCPSINPAAAGGPQQSQHAMDIPTLAQLSQFTAGEFHYYPNFNALGCGDKLRQELVHSLTRPSGWEAVMRIRVSRGWKITNWYGHFFFRHSDLLVLPNCHEDQTFTVTLEIEENVAPDPYLYLQSALLYTNSDGERRIRVHTVCLPVTQNLNELACSADEPAIASVLGHQAIELAQKKNLADARQFLQMSCGQILSSLTQANPASTPMLPHYMLGALKCMAFREGREATPDLRISHWLRYTSSPVQTILSYFYPRLISLHDMPEECGTADVNQETILPPTLGLSASHMSQAGVYLIEDGECMMMWIGKAVDPTWLQSVLAVDNIDHINPEHADSFVGTTGTELGRRVASVVNAVRHSQLPFMKLFVIKQGTPMEHKFFCSLIEDRSHAFMMSYSEFMQKIGSRASLGSLPPATTAGGYGAHGAGPMSGHQPPQQQPAVPYGAQQQYGAQYGQQQPQQHQPQYGQQQQPAGPQSQQPPYAMGARPPMQQQPYGQPPQQQAAYQPPGAQQAYYGAPGSGPYQ